MVPLHGRPRTTRRRHPVAQEEVGPDQPTGVAPDGCWDRRRCASWPSSQRLGMMKPSRGVVGGDAEGSAAPGGPSGDGTPEGAGAERRHVGVAQGGVVDDRVEPTKGLWRVAYWSVAAPTSGGSSRSAGGRSPRATGRVGHPPRRGPGRWPMSWSSSRQAATWVRGFRRVFTVEFRGDRGHRGRVDAPLAHDLALGVRGARGGRRRRPHRGRAVALGRARSATGPRPGRCSCRGCRGRSRSSGPAAPPAAQGPVQVGSR